MMSFAGSGSATSADVEAAGRAGYSAVVAQPLKTKKANAKRFMGANPTQNRIHRHALAIRRSWFGTAMLTRASQQFVVTIEHELRSDDGSVGRSHKREISMRGALRRNVMRRRQFFHSVG